MTRAVVCGLMMTCFCAGSQAADEPVFSGPQVGEKLPSFTIRGVLGGEAGKKLDLIARADGKPLLIVFVHQRTRPAFGLTNAVMRFAATRSKQGLVGGVCFLTDDATATENWVKRVSQHLVKGVVHGISADGIEGPGVYGLNRNVALTVLVGKEGKVTANFALVQPSMQADGPKILAAIVEATGGGKVPPIAQFSRRRNAGQRMKRDPKLAALVRPLLRKEASAEDVKKAVAAVEEHLAKNRAAGRQIGQTAARLAGSKDFEQLGTEAARKQIRKWAKKYAPRKQPRAEVPNLRPLLRPVIDKSASPEQVDKAAMAVEEFVAKNEVARKEVGRIARTIVDSGKLKNYGTPRAQEYLRKWAKEYGSK